MSNSREMSTVVLTNKMRIGASLEAAGIPAEQIAEATGVNKKTVREWGKNELYLKELDRVGRLVEQKIEPMLLDSQVEIIQAGNDGIRELRNIALNATLKNGAPANQLRMQASIALASHLMKMITLVYSGGNSTGEGDDNSTNFIQNNLNIKINEDGSIEASTIDGEATEVS